MEWRYRARTISKYNPIYRSENGNYNIDEWVGFFQIGQKFNNKVFTFEEYLNQEAKYIKAGILFFQYHNCERIIIKNIEKKDISNYNYKDRIDLLDLLDRITDRLELGIESLEDIVKLILRELIWGELFCVNTEEISLRFGYDFYMYFNSNRNFDEVLKKVKKLGLFVE